MSIRLRLTLLYSAILALTLGIFGVALYTRQAQTTLESLKQDLVLSGNPLVESIARGSFSPFNIAPRPEPPQSLPLENLTGDEAFRKLREREIVRVLDSSGILAASPFGGVDEALPLSQEGLAILQNERYPWWETVIYNQESYLVYNVPILRNGDLAGIVQIARSLTERNRSLASLGRTLLTAGVVTLGIAFGAGWFIAGATLGPIQTITQTAQTIGREQDFTRRVEYQGPQDEVGQLATTFNTMLARVEEAYQNIRRALDLQRRFVADVSHELRTPLTTIRGNLGLLNRQPPPAPEIQADILNDMVDESDRLIRLVNDLLVLARADAGQAAPRLEPVDVKTMCAEVVRQVGLLAPQRNITQQVKEITVLSDRDVVKQILLILLDNALKHSTGNITLAAERLGNQVQFSVQDQGPGIPQEVLVHVFDRFYRAESNTMPGFGLGLSIAKALVENQGGSIQISSQPGQGSRVTFALPAG